MGRILRGAGGLCAAAVLVLIWPPPVHARPAADRTAPSLQLKTLDGKTVRLADRKGRVVVLDFWASWCAPCKATFPALNMLAAEFADRGVDVLAINEDEKRKDLDAFLAGANLRLQVLLDARGDAAGAFGVTAIPSMYVIDRDGTIRFSHPNYAPEVIDVVRREIAPLIAPAAH